MEPYINSLEIRKKNTYQTYFMSLCKFGIKTQARTVLERKIENQSLCEYECQNPEQNISKMKK